MKTVLQAMQDITPYNVYSGLFNRLRVKAGMAPHVYCPATKQLLDSSFADHEADLIAKIMYDYSVMVNAKTYEEFAAGVENVQSADRVTFSGNWLAGLKSNVEQIWADIFILPDLSKITKGHLAEAKEIIFAETCKGMAEHGPEKAMKNAQYVQLLTMAMNEKRKVKPESKPVEAVETSEQAPSTPTA